MAKDRYSQQTAKQGIVAICVLELLAFFVHLAMFNMRLWDANQAGKLPFSVQDGWMHIPFVIALCLALLVSLTAIYAVTTTLSLTKEKVRAENWESENTGQKW